MSNSLPADLLKQLDRLKNRRLGIDDSALTKGSHKSVWWVCVVGHSWEAVVYTRAAGTGCPYCSGRRALSTTCLTAINPKLASEWHPTKNDDLTPEAVTPGSCRKVWWRCSSGHEWQAIVKNRTNKDGCTVCSGKKASPETCLASIDKVLAAEWHGSKNELSACDVTPGSSKKVWWECSCGNEWKASVKNRALKGAGCPHCAHSSISKASQQWLDSLGVPQEHREHSLRLPGRKRPIRVDGFDPATNTVYEFLGDFWHGNPERFPPDEVNPRTSKPYGVLYHQTIRRFERLRKAGYTVVFIWEKDFNSQLVY